jgi:hypothetical protein
VWLGKWFSIDANTSKAYDDELLSSPGRGRQQGPDTRRFISFFVTCYELFQRIGDFMECSEGRRSEDVQQDGRSSKPTVRSLRDGRSHSRECIVCFASSFLFPDPFNTGSVKLGAILLKTAVSMRSM